MAKKRTGIVIDRAIPECTLEGCDGVRFASEFDAHRHRKEKHGLGYPATNGQINRIRDLQLITHDHTLVEGVFDIGKLTQSQADQVIIRHECEIIKRDRKVAGV